METNLPLSVSSQRLWADLRGLVISSDAGEGAASCESFNVHQLIYLRVQVLNADVPGTY